MSCITKLLELKGDEPFMVHDNHTVIEGGGIYKGYEWLVVLNGMGFRCGYIALPQGHRLHGIEDPDLEVHGGITLSNKQHLIKSDCNDWWLGFDAGHSWDGQDLQKLKEYFGESKHITEMTHCFEGTVKDFDYMQKQCEHLIDQVM